MQLSHLLQLITRFLRYAPRINGAANATTEAEPCLDR
jgi:hypothetical protein